MFCLVSENEVELYKDFKMVTASNMSIWLQIRTIQSKAGVNTDFHTDFHKFVFAKESDINVDGKVFDLFF